MASPGINSVVHHLWQWAAGQETAGASDQQLLERFVFPDSFVQASSNLPAPVWYDTRSHRTGYWFQVLKRQG